MKKITLAVATVLGMAALPAFSQSWYLGGGIGRGNLDVSGTDLGLPNAQVGDNATSYTARLGYRFTPWLAGELGYYDFGEFDFSSQVGGANVAGTAKAKAFGISLVGILPVGPAFDLYGRLGYGTAEIKANASVAGFTGNAKEDESGMIYGVGGRWNVSRNWGIFAEWTKADKIEVDSYLIGVDFRF